jgi:hypothetical protein
MTPLLNSDFNLDAFHLPTGFLPATLFWQFIAGEGEKDIERQSNSLLCSYLTALLAVKVMLLPCAIV